MIDTSGWKEFRFDSIFDVCRGDRIVKDVDFIAEKTDEYKYPVITAKTTENGVDGYYTKYNCEGNCLVACGEASGMFTTYQTGKCWCLDTVRIITLKNGRSFNTKNALFLAALFTQEMYRYSYGRKAKPDNMNALVLKLPVTPSGEPDWQYMEDFMGRLHCEPVTTSVKSSHLPLETEKWGEFSVGDLFDVKYGVNLELNALEEQPSDGEDAIAFVGRSADNNGVTAYVRRLDNVLPQPKDTITVAGGGSVLSTFVQPDEFYSGRDLYLLLPKTPISIYMKLFVKTIIETNQYRFNYGRQANKTLPDLILSLPITSDGTPDWQWMEDYIKSLPYSDRIDMRHLEILLHSCYHDIMKQ